MSTLGVNLSLPPGTAAEYERRRAEELDRRRMRRGEEEAKAKARSEENAGDDGGEPMAGGRSPDDGPELVSDDASGGTTDGGDAPYGAGVQVGSDHEIMPFRLPSGDDRGGLSRPERGSSSDGWGSEDGPDGDGGGSDDGDDEEEISLSPPATMPLLVVDLEELTGCRPKNLEEKKMLVDQLREALLGGSSDATTSAERELPKDGSDGDAEKGSEAEADAAASMALDFNERSAELLGMGVAAHADTSTASAAADGTDGEREEELLHAVIEYPEFLSLPPDDPSSESGSTVLPTARMWKSLTSPHPTPCVSRLLSHLAVCSRDLVWRYRMNAEVRSLARAEEAAKRRKEREEELNVWRTERRPAELERLYQVRETFEYRLEAARNELGRLLEEREGRIRAEIARRKEAGLGGGGVAGLDWAEGAATFAFGNDDEGAQHEEGVLGSAPKYEEDAEDVDSGYEYEGGSGEESDISEGQSDGRGGADLRQSLESADEPSVLSTSAQRRRNRAAATSKRLRKRLAKQEEAAKRQAMLGAAREEERRVRELCKKPEEHMAQAVVSQLEERVEKVDELLEQLQEEEWADEEDGLIGGRSQSPCSAVGGQEREERPLLDQILAMVLGALKPAPGKSKEEHFTFVRDEHLGIIQAWREHFGRLPSPSEEQPSSEAFIGAAGGASPRSDAVDDALGSAVQNGMCFSEASPSIDINKRSAPSALPEVAPTPEAMRSMLGITDNNAADDWDDVQDWDALLPGIGGGTPASATLPPALTAKAEPPKPKKTGLRPGGSSKSNS